MSRVSINTNIFSIIQIPFSRTSIVRLIESPMKFSFLVSFLLFGCSLCQSQAAVYEESIGEMLSQCNLYQREVFQANRTKHLCEKSDADDDFSYYITEIKTRYSQAKFLCLLFFKDEHFKLKFKFWFSHANFSVNAVSEN